MQYYTFQHIFDEFSKQKVATKAEDHDIGKVRDKFTEIIDVVGINVDLLRKYKDEETEKMISHKGRQFYFPEAICEFCIEILKRYTDWDFKLLRKGEYKDVPLETLAFLIDGFTKYLKDLGYDHDTIISERFKMKRRMGYDISIQLFQLNQECRELLKDAEGYTGSNLDLLYDDKVYFAFYMVKKLNKLRDYIASVHGNFSDIRLGETGDFAKEISSNVKNPETKLDADQTSILADALENDQDYQDLLKKQMDILCTRDFIKKLKTSYNKNNDKIKTIQEQYAHELFGDNYKNQQLYPTNNFTPTHPLPLLYDAITYTDETEQDEVETREREAYITDEQREKQKEALSKIYNQLFPFPDPEHMEQIKKRGIIKYPCCTEGEIAVYTEASGYIVNKCPKCNKQVRFNLDEMTAEIYEPPKGHMKQI